MKFGKRLGVEAGRGWQGAFLDYKACKRAISKDVILEDCSGSAFETVVKAQLRSINSFFAEKEAELKAVMSTVQPGMLTAVRTELFALRKCSILNATAIIKAVKKRNKHLGKAVGKGLCAVNATQLLNQQYFFTSDNLAKLLTKAEIMTQEGCATEDVGRALEEYECPICLSVLENPVILSCAHRFCWGCLLSHCATCQDVQHDAQLAQGKAEKAGQRLVTAILGDTDCTTTYPCPVCRKSHPLDLDRLKVDERLAAFICDLKRRNLQPDGGASCQQGQLQGSAQSILAHPLPPSTALQGNARQLQDAVKVQEDGTDFGQAKEQEVEAEEIASSSAINPPLLPPQSPEMKGRMTVVLDLDGTLISSFAPRRGPSFSKSCNSYVAGKGAKLNPNGVLVVERPELGHFLQELYKFAEVVLFTAGLEDYASPICTRLQDRYGNFQATLYRPATVATNEYPCVKDLSLLGRDMRRTVLVDDTPLAFLHQPDNGIPIFSFRGDEDDRVLVEAILPLLQQLVDYKDVRPVLHRRFNMPNWLLSHGITVPAKQGAVSQQDCAPQCKADLEGEISHTLILTDFDKTLTDCDAGERLVGEVAPELVPMLACLQQPANFVGLTNAVLREVARRGVSASKLTGLLKKMGTEIPESSRQLLHWAHAQQTDVRIISDCNSHFISSVLKGAGLDTLVKQVITNPAEWSTQTRSASASELAVVGAKKPSQKPESCQHLVISPRHCAQKVGLHHCPLCPANLCKGLELQKLRKQKPYKRVLYLGDGANDLCPVLKLEQQDVVFARKGYDLDNLLQERCQAQPTAVRATVHVWHTHSHLFQLIRDAKLS